MLRKEEENLVETNSILAFFFSFKLGGGDRLNFIRPLFLPFLSRTISWEQKEKEKWRWEYPSFRACSREDRLHIYNVLFFSGSLVVHLQMEFLYHYRLKKFYKKRKELTHLFGDYEQSKKPSIDARCPTTFDISVIANFWFTFSNCILTIHPIR